MLMSYQFVGFHGTDKEAAANIISTNTIWASNKGDEWLGKGVYFFWDADDSCWWCTDRSGLTSYVILRADLTANRTVDLVHRRKDQERFRHLCDRVEKMSAKLPDGSFRQNYLSLALKLMVKEIRPDIIIGGFDQNRKFWFTQKNYEQIKKFPVIPLQVQFCVLNKECIGEISVFQEVG